MNQITPYLLWAKCGAVALLVIGLYGIGHHQGAKGVQADWDVAKTKIVAAENAAVLQRTADNTALAAKQSETNTKIEVKDESELAPVRRAIAADRVRIGPALCSGAAASAQAESPASGHAPDPAPRLVPPELESRIRELEVRVEEALATGRACQQFVRDNGME